MKSKISTSIPNSVLLIMDLVIGVIPETLAEELVAVTPSCIAIGTVSESDGEVEIELTDETPIFDGSMQRVVETRLQTPSREVSVYSIHWDKLLTINVKHEIAGVQVWVNHLTEPDRIVVVVRCSEV
ncbi:MAG: hypothetical protein ACKOFW_04565 [Planctomycetaceae bacterium]